jgi:superfamily II DNA or RNA helicase
MAHDGHRTTTPGDLVGIRDEPWLVTTVEPFDRCAVLRLEGRGPSNKGVRFSVIEPFDRPAPTPTRRFVRRPRAAVLAGALASVADARPADGLWAAADARISLLPYQLEPALAVLAGRTRVLLADEVGLGKTIQAGLILAELAARGLAERALVLTPAGLRHAWAEELRTRFHLRADVVDHASIARLRPLLPPGANPWLSSSVLIASLDFAKRAEVLAAIAQVPFDALIVDEAHHLTPGSDRGAAVAGLARQAPWVLLLSATPHSGDESAFAYLTGLGARNDRLAVFRRSRREAGLAGQRHVTLLAVRPSPDEEALLGAAIDYACAIWRGRGASDFAARLVAMTIARRAASSAHALHRTVTRRLALIASPPGVDERQMELPWDDTDAGDDDADREWLSTPGLTDREEERRRLEALADLAARARQAPSKIRRVLRMLDRAREPAVVFTEYRDTLLAIADALGPSRRSAVIHGGLQPCDRDAAVASFVRGGADVLLATDTAGEGLNLQQRCRLVVTMELPWNPMRLEQRIGRVDRIGQRRRVHAIHLYHRGSVEDVVLATLERRRQRAIEGLSGGFAGEQEMACAVVGGEPLVERAGPPVARESVPRATQEAERLAECRRRRTVRIPESDAMWTWARRGRVAAPEVVLLFDVRHFDADMRLLDRAGVALKAALARAPRRHGEWRRVLARLTDLAAVERVLADWSAARAPELAAMATSRHADLRARLAEILRDLGASRSWRHQMSLFDNRAEQEAVFRRRAAERIERHMARRLAHVRPLEASQLVRRVRLVAAFPAAARSAVTWSPASAGI